MTAATLNASPNDRCQYKSFGGKMGGGVLRFACILPAGHAGPHHDPVGVTTQLSALEHTTDLTPSPKVTAICTKCRQLYPAAAHEPLLPVHICPRCFAVDQLLKTADEMHAQVKRALDDHQSLGARTVARSALVRLQADVARVRSLS